MKWTKEPKKAEKYFAWGPVEKENNEWVWMEWIYYRTFECNNKSYFFEYCTKEEYYKLMNN